METSNSSLFDNDVNAFWELYNLTEDTGRDFDFHGYSVNVAAQEASTVHALAVELRDTMETWY